jgi:hypothetical protein
MINILIIISKCIKANDWCSIRLIILGAELQELALMTFEVELTLRYLKNTHRTIRTRYFTLGEFPKI